MGHEDLPDVIEETEFGEDFGVGQNVIIQLKDGWQVSGYFFAMVMDSVKKVATLIILNGDGRHSVDSEEVDNIGIIRYDIAEDE